MTDEETIKRLERSIEKRDGSGWGGRRDQSHAGTLLSATSAPMDVEMQMSKSFSDTISSSLWYETPNPKFFGRTPRQQIALERDGKASVMEELKRLEQVFKK